MDSRMAYVLMLPMVLAACAEKNFVPGSPLARLSGHTRSYEQIAADDCAAKAARGSESHTRCVYQTVAARRRSDEAQRQTSQDMMLLGTSTLATPAPPPQPAPPKEHVCIAANNTVYRC